MNSPCEGTHASRLRSVCHGLLISGRPATSLVAGALTGLTLVFGGVQSAIATLGGALAILTLTMAGFVVNDIQDRAKDNIQGLQRPITTGKISIPLASIFSCMLVAVSLTVTPSNTGRMIVAAASIALYFYSSFARFLPCLKGAYTAAISCTPLFYGAVVSGAGMPVGTYILLFCFIAGRELYLDVLDAAGDQAFGLRTIPVLIGRRAAMVIGGGLMVGASSILPILTTTPLGAGASLAGTLILLLILGWPGISLRQRIALTRFPMLISALALATTAIAIR